MTKILISLVVVVTGVFLVGYFLKGKPAGYQQSATPNASNQSQSAAQPASGEQVVAIKNFAFTPTMLTVSAGTKVTWKNEDSVGHSIKGLFATSSVFGSGQTFSFTFQTPGQYDYSCGVHPNMKGIIVVK